jgi:zinc protease
MKRISTVTILIFLPFLLSANTLNFERWTTKNGVKVYFVQAMQIPIVDIKLAFKAGSAFDGKHWGIATITNQLLNQKAGGLSATTLAEKLENNGSLFGSNVTRDMGTISLRSLSAASKLTPSLKVFETILTQPDFDKASIERTKKQIETAIKHQAEVPQSLANNVFYQKLYGSHPYAHSPLGTIKSTQNIHGKDIKHFYQTHYVSNNAVLAIVGAISKKKAMEIASTLTRRLPQSTLSYAIPVAKSAHYKKNNLSYASNQSIIRIGQIGIRYDNPNRFPLTVGNYTLGGGGLVSRLADEIREKRGLSYGISSYFLPLEAKGPFLVSLATKNKQTDEALKVTNQTLARFIKEGPSEKELVAAKKYIIGSFPLRFLSNSDILNTISLMGFYDLPNNYLDTYLDKVKKVTKKDIQQAFQQEVNTNNLLTVVVGKTS